MRPVACAVIVSGFLAACESRPPPRQEEPPPAPAQEAAPAPATPPPAAPAPAARMAGAQPPNQVDLAFDGAFTASLVGKAGRCGPFQRDPDRGATFSVRSEDLGVAPPFDLTIVVTSDAEWTNPPIALNLRGEPPVSYVRNIRKPPPGDKVDLARDRSAAAVDVTLQQVAGSRRVHVKGSIRCQAP